MSLVLAVEPDAKQADVLRRIIGRQDDTELIVVTSAYAATSMMKRRVPDLVLLGASLGAKSQEIIDIFCLVSAAENPQTLWIPPAFADAQGRSRWLGSRKPDADPELFAAEVATCLARAAEQRQPQIRPEAAAPQAAPPATAQREVAAQEDAAAAPAEALVAVAEPPLEAISSAASSDALEESVADAPSILINLESATSGDARVDPEVHAAQLALLQARAEARLADELERVRREAEDQRAAELARLREEADAQRHAEVAEAREAAATEARDALSAELAKVRSEAEGTLAEELARVQAEAAQRLAEQLAEAEASHAAAVEEARIATEQAAIEALETEVARINAETEARLTDELRRVHEQAEQARRAHEQTLQTMEWERDAAAQEGRAAAEEAAARALAAEVARVRQESDARLAAELARAHAEADAAGRAQQQAQLELETAREAAERDARATAEGAATRALEDEVERVRAEADARLQRELARIRAEVEQTRQAHEQAQVEADAARDAAVREALEGAEAAAAQAHEIEVARVRADAEARLRAELVRVREEAEHARVAGESEVEEIRRRAELEAMALAEGTLEREIARARADADARLKTEVAEVRAEAERRRVAELAQMRAQLAQMHESAREHAREDARSAVAGTISEGVARAKVTVPRAGARVVAQVGSHTAVATVRAAGVVLRWLGRSARAALPLMRTVWERLPARTVPAVAVLLLLAGAAMVVDVSSVPGAVRSLAESSFTAASRVFSGTSQAVRASLEREDAPRASESPDAPAGPDSPGFLAVFSRVPLDLVVSGRRIGTTEDGQILLAAGRYRVGLVNTRLNYRGEVTLVVRPAEVTSHTVSLPEGRLQVNTEPGAEIWVEGARAGVAPLAPLPVPIGTREILVRHPDLGERREYVEIRYGEVAEVNINRREVLNPGALPRLDQPGPRIR